MTIRVRQITVGTTPVALTSGKVPATVRLPAGSPSVYVGGPDVNTTTKGTVNVFNSLIFDYTPRRPSDILYGVVESGSVVVTVFEDGL